MEVRPVEAGKKYRAAIHVLEPGKYLEQGEEIVLLDLPLAARNETLTVLPGPLPDADLIARMRAADTLVVMKVGRHLSRLRTLLAAEGLLDRAVYVERATLPSERRMPLADAPDPAPYFSMILVTKGADPWL